MTHHEGYFWALQQQAIEADKIKGTQRANIGLSGASGTRASLKAIQDQAGASELENLLIGFEGETALKAAKAEAEGIKFVGETKGRQQDIDFAVELATAAAGTGAGKKFLGGFGKKKVLSTGTPGPGPMGGGFA